MPRQTKAIQKFKVINYDANSDIIPDISKVILPPDLSLAVYNLIIDDQREKRLEQANEKI
ncbi:hypothetical protein [Melissococcus plutonius]|uniref:Uncharacterized protein n=1 Tax=Melissococcus plutonius (strain ATCC 35311 / DSM 29964 / CIP 104052 / LMG 20360 / NCIMB 702443) TaxID=940190 RepID=F3YBJ4_MELPT|nr:hypothetical protein [Melissococcus plutonius]KMT33293.1 hypothetical protein MEPL6_1c03280 [Melissococcus plutonius]KMT33639.1 hypothetical protein MEPL8_7c00770 [Melissococcus plutonius]KMT38998.1 hypothetical protein MEPL12_5c01040 [Melissococcus plutonius]MBB5177528.1 hypothetical protein [Melissococcus plutonius]BAK21872.1 hypothetical protein MPTP_1443 [Melissococcus plutonius ATCC 35311]